MKNLDCYDSLLNRLNNIEWLQSFIFNAPFTLELVLRSKSHNLEVIKEKLRLYFKECAIEEIVLKITSNISVQKKIRLMLIKSYLDMDANVLFNEEGLEDLLIDYEYILRNDEIDSLNLIFSFADIESSYKNLVRDLIVERLTDTIKFLFSNEIANTFKIRDELLGA
ncbi:hypothetical protein [Bacillus toyonensis]|uniref:hypothetical protein n=1 Tax=Bacillus toyonensis TaxID=155322 RepID=UPI002E2023C7|nr:hypothetical protein [Bacillus toyonensis]